MGRGRAVHSAAKERSAAAEAVRYVRFVDDHLHEPFTLAGLAARLGQTPSHLARRFRALHGESPIDYLRRRRLAEAGRRLVESAEPIASLALAAGFASQAAFTRAFRRATGQTPAAVRRAGHLPPLSRRTALSHPDITERTAIRNAFDVVGLARRLEPATYAEAGELWAQAAPRFAFAGVFTETIGAFRDRDAAGGFEHLAGVARPQAGKTPDGFITWTIPAGHWRVFRQVLTAEPLHLQMLAAEQVIRSERLTNGPSVDLSAPDLQIYPHPFRLEGGWVEHWFRLAAPPI